MSNEVTMNNVTPSSFDHLPTMKRWLMKSLAKIHHGTLFVYLDGNCYACGNDESIIAHLHIHKSLKMTLRCITKGDLGFAESYIEEDFSSPDLTQLLMLLLKNRNKLGKTYGGKSVLRIATNVYHSLRKNSLKGSRKNIQYHYDLGNDFYELWLDKSMTYSSALFTPEATPQQEQSLEEAQKNKYQRIINEINPNKGDSILEVGCGWGGFAELAVKNDCKVHGITLSDEQLSYAKKRLENHTKNATLEIKDYREVDQQYDHIVSIEMFEAVGEEYWETYFEMLKRCLKPDGKIVLQIITIKDEYYDFYKRRSDFIQRYIFPGGMLPSNSILDDLADKSGLKIQNKITFGHGYQETLSRWEKRFKQVIPDLETLGYDKRFQRMWFYYLAYCQAGFEEKRIDVVQLTLTHTNNE